MGWLWEALKFAGQWLANRAATYAVDVARFAWMIALAVGRFAAQIGIILAKVYGLLARFYAETLKPFAAWAFRQIERLSAWLQRTLGPVLRILEKVRREIDKIYDRWFRPIFDTIAVARRILQLLARLGVPGARELDAQLAKLEARLLWPIQQLYYRLNEAMNWINRIITLDGLLQQITLLRSLWAHAADSWSILVDKQLEDLDVTAAPRLRARPYPALTPAAAAAPLVEYVRTGGGADAAQMRDLSDALSAATRRAT